MFNPGGWHGSLPSAKRSREPFGVAIEVPRTASVGTSFTYMVTRGHGSQTQREFILPQTRCHAISQNCVVVDPASSNVGQKENQ